MPKRTNLNTTESPIKFIIGCVVLLALSGIGMFWLTGQSKKEVETIESVTEVEPTKAVLPTTSENNNVASESAEVTPTPNEKLSPTPKEIELLIEGKHRELRGFLCPTS